MPGAMYAKADGVWTKVFPPPVPYNDATGGVVTEFDEVSLRSKVDGQQFAAGTGGFTGNVNTRVEAVGGLLVVTKLSASGTGGSATKVIPAKPGQVFTLSADVTNPAHSDMSMFLSPLSDGTTVIPDTAQNVNITEMDGQRASVSVTMPPGTVNLRVRFQFGPAQEPGVVVSLDNVLLESGEVANPTWFDGASTLVKTGRRMRAHTFTSTADLTILKNGRPFHTFLLGGGGSGGGTAGGGGGGGRAVEARDTTLPLGVLPFTIGGGGAPTTLSDITAAPGGNGSPFDGGDGSGGASNFPGGSGIRASYAERGGGGGGAGSAGDPAGGAGGAGGYGATTTIRGLEERFGGGGGGGAARDTDPGGGRDGGGSGVKGGTGGGGAANTGGGGGGGGYATSGPGGPGGSGIGIVAYEIEPPTPPPPGAAPVITGGVVEQNGEWTVHTFTDSGDLVVTQGGDAEWFLIAGGGAGGWGGGGAGGVIPPKTVTLAPGTYPVVIGDGGAAAACNVEAANGQDSTFNGETAVGGGGGAKQPAPAEGKTGGSGGGANGGAAGTGTPGQGYDGGGTYIGHGGGAGGPGGTTDENDSYGTSGIGVDIWGTTYASGGTKGMSDMNGAPETSIPPAGGGGRGSRGPNAAQAGTDGTGGGGGGGGVNSNWTAFGTSGKGGKGIFKIRYRSA